MRHVVTLTLLLALTSVCFARPAAESEADRWLRVLSDPKPKSWSHAIRELEKLGAEALPQLRLALMDPHPNTRLQAARLIGELGPDGRPAMDALAHALKDRHATVRQFTLDALGKLGPLPKHIRDQIVDVTQFSRQKRRDSRYLKQALRVLLNQGANAAPELRKFLPDQQNDMGAVIREIGPQAVDALIPLLGDESWYVRESAVWLAGSAQGGPARIRDVLLTRLQDEASAVRYAAVRTFERGRQKDRSVPIALAARTEDHHLIVRRAAVKALGHMVDWDEIRAQTLIRCASDPDAATRHQAVRALRRRGDGEAVLETLRMALMDREPDIRADAALALVLRGKREAGLARYFTHAMRGHGLMTDPPFRIEREIGGGSRETRTGLPPILPSDLARGIAALGPLAVPMLKNELATSMVLCRANAVWMLGHIPEGTTDLLAARLDDPHRAVRVMAAYRLLERRACLEDASRILVDALVRVVPFEKVPGGPVAPLLAEGPKFPWRGRVERLLVSLGADAVPALVQFWSGHRRELEAVLRGIGDVAKPALQKLVEGEDTDQRSAAADMLETLGS